MAKFIALILAATAAVMVQAQSCTPNSRLCGSVILTDQRCKHPPFPLHLPIRPSTTSVPPYPSAYSTNAHPIPDPPSLPDLNT